MDKGINNDISVTKLLIKGENVYLKLCWEKSKDCLFNVTLYDSNNNSWSGQFSSEFASLIDEPEEEYKNNVKNGLMGKCSDFVFNFVHVPGQSTAKFTWTKIFDDSTEMPYGFVDLHLDNEIESKDKLLDHLLNENNELKDLLEIYNRNNTALNDKVEKCKSELQEFVNEKIALESNLYGKFVQLLNEKKERIRLLEESIQNME
ncbi:unnamed protein product [Diatraea saccharalis]|uniref:Uncharacterized protein n=1 Tax=Diatraea saccharalis TaxID=40085 RepID=A0A9N9R475_9NEOP|nr:unnamed protein product [Diatraea saccharalis]